MRRMLSSACTTLAVMALVLTLLLSSTLFAQNTGQITGTVVDATGAAIVNAKVILTDQATRATRQTVSNGVGFFSFSAVMPANYDLKVEAKNFKSLSITGIHMSPGDKRDITRVEMSVGATAESVTVEATVTGVDIVSSPEKSSMITAHDIERQSTVGRNALELVRLLPGMTVRSGMENRSEYDPTVQHLSNSPTNNYGMNGLAPLSGGQSISSDGAQLLDVGNMRATLATVNKDMVQEVKVQTSNFSADTNRGPIVINAVSKSGSNSYHGAGYFYARNNVLNAIDWFNKSQLNGQKPTDNSYYYPGANIGGPVKIPGTNIDKKMFFFVGVEVYRQNLPQDPILSVVPTEGMRKGDFSWASMSPLCAPQMPVGWQPFQQNPNIANVNQGPSYCYTPTLYWDMQTWNWGNPNDVTRILDGQVPSSIINPATQAYLTQWLPKPNTTPTSINSFSNFVQSYSNAENSWQLHPRVDYNFNDNNKLNVTYNLQKETSPTARAQWWAPQSAMLYPGKVQAQITSNVASANLLHVFSPTLTSETVLAMSYFRGPIVLTDPKAVSRAGMDFPMIFDNGVDQLPAISGGGIPSLQMQSGFIDNKWLLNKSTATLQENVTKVFRTHTLKVGGNFERIADSGNGVGNTAGNISFAGNDWQLQWAGAAGNYSGWQGCNASAANPTCFNPVANMLFGWVGNYSQDQAAFISGLKYNTAGLFATDNWKVSKRLTLDLGMRYDYIQPWTDLHGIGLAVFDPQLYAQQVTVNPVTMATTSTVQYPGMKWHAMDKSVPLAGRETKWGFISPRLGLSWDMFGTGKWVLRGGWGSYYFQAWHGAESGALVPGQGQHSFNGSEPGGGWNLASIAAQKGTSQLFGDGSASFVTPGQKQPVTTNWNFTISHPTVWGSFLEVSYVGNQSSNQLTPGKNESINLIPIGTMYDKPYYTPALGDNNKTAKLSALSGWKTAQDWYRPYTWYNDQLTTNLTNGWANYHALQVSWNRNKGWATFGLNYTFSKAMGIYNDQDAFNLQSEYGPLNFDRTHAFNSSYSFDLGNHVHGDFAGSKILKGVANGWQLSGITQVQSGPPYQAINSANLGFNTWVYLLNTHNYNPTGDPLLPNVASQTVPMDSVNVLGTPDVSLWPTIAPGCDPTAHNGDPHSVFNTNCFVAPQFLQNAKHSMGYFHSPGYFSSDLTMAKSFQLSERKKLQFRVSAFNFLNHPLRGFNSQDYSGRVNNLSSMVNPNNPSTNNSYVPGQSFVPTDWYGNTLGNVNTVGTPNIKRGNRLIMLGVKFEF